MAQSISNGCINVMDQCIHISVIQPLTVSVSIVAAANPVPYGTAVTFTATGVNGGTSPVWQWKVNNVNVGTNSNSFTYVPLNNDQVACVLVSSEGCVTGPATSNTITMTVTGVPVNVTVSGTVLSGQEKCYNASGTLTVAGSGTAFTVENGGSAIFIAGQNIRFMPGTTVVSGAYMHGYISTDYCVVLAPTMVTTPTGTTTGTTTNGTPNVETVPVPEVTEFTGFTIYPNPTLGNFTIAQVGGKVSEAVHVEIYGAYGERVASFDYNNEARHAVSMPELAQGVYFVNILAEGKVSTIKLVRVK
jgi:hypothetical protein